ncbi:MAG TPA: cell envelope integrity protein CreD [Bacteroidales bacterium]|jgi:inner membrane protein|nr:cell envelope integrity protein CreD [Bacteroidales bacterium]HRS18217.1 cell envelope integrity protein CreD [Bacteroidales bacterium]
MQPESQTTLEKVNSKVRNSLTFRVITIVILILLLLIPVSMIQSLISEREFRQQEATTEVSSKWANEQIVTGPILTVPYKTFVRVQQNNGMGDKLVESIEYAHFLPNTLQIHSIVKPEVRKRGIFKVIVYTTQLTVSGDFVEPSFKEWDISPEHILWKDAFVSIGMTDLRGIKEQIQLQWNQQKLLFEPGVQTNDVIESGLSCKLTRDETSIPASSFSYTIQLNGSSKLQFTPIGKTTTVNMQAKWGDPKFDGAFLPDTKTITKDSVTASWKVLHVNRSYPQQFKGSVQNRIQESAFGVELKVPVDEYQKSMRSAKYAALFITLTFLIFFFIEVLHSVRIHPMQYIIVGLALCVFYTLLIAISEHITFAWSYLIASFSIITLIGIYAHYMFKHIQISTIFVLLLSLLYGFIFTIIQSEDYALLMGSVGLFVVLAIVMYLSRKIDWYSIHK